MTSVESYANLEWLRRWPGFFGERSLNERRSFGPARRVLENSEAAIAFSAWANEHALVLFNQLFDNFIMSNEHLARQALIVLPELGASLNVCE
jgi:hypothetical protein